MLEVLGISPTPHGNEPIVIEGGLQESPYDARFTLAHNKVVSMGLRHKDHTRNASEDSADVKIYGPKAKLCELPVAELDMFITAADLIVRSTLSKRQPFLDKAA